MTTKKVLDNEQRVKIFKALSDEKRLEIILTLYTNKKEKSFGAVGYICDASKSNVSYHIRTLKEAKLIKVRKEAQTKYVSLDLDTFHTYLPGFLDTL
jgi:ArsR family transcriptional regulator, lead/cadmium/zinc/bismuth-responsive transcriptional repressor